MKHYCKNSNFTCFLPSLREVLMLTHILKEHSNRNNNKTKKDHGERLCCVKYVSCYYFKVEKEKFYLPEYDLNK